MIKKFLLLSLVASQLFVSCSSDDNNDEETKPETELTLEEQIANIIKQPYSNLSPSDQKIKLETEANEILTQLDKTKSSGAIEAIQNLGRLLSVKQIDIFDGKSDNGIEEILTVSDVYGIYTWNNTEKMWVKTASTTELKFVFPAKEGQTSNNAVLSSKSTSSTIKFSNVDTYGDWGYNEETGEYGQISPSIQDWFYLPLTADAILTIDGGQAATLASSAKYASNKSPEEFSYKLTLNDGYTWEMSGKKGTETISKASLTFNGKNLLEFNGGSNADIDKLISNDELTQYRGKANGLIKILDNFVILSDTDLAGQAADEIALESSLTRPKYPNDSYNPDNKYKEYYTALKTYELKRSQGRAANFNKNTTATLISLKDGSKIATIVQHSEKVGDDYVFNLPVWKTSQWSETGGYWDWNEDGEVFSLPYNEEVSYLKFNDNTEVEVSVYFSTGFTNLTNKVNDFINSFNKQK